MTDIKPFLEFTIAALVIILAYAVYKLWQAHKPWDGEERRGR